MSEQHQIRDGRTKNWFYLDNELIDEFGGDGKGKLGIGVYAIAVYTVLARRANDEHKCWPSYAGIAANLDISRNTVIRAITTLEKVGLISIEQRVSHEQGKPTTTNIYTMLNIKTPSASSEHPSASQGIGSSPEGIGVVQDRVYPSAPQGPKEDSFKNTNNKKINTANAAPSSPNRKRLIEISPEADKAYQYAVEWSGEDRAPKGITKQWCEKNIQEHGLKTVLVAITRNPGKVAAYLEAVMRGLSPAELGKYTEEGRPVNVSNFIPKYQPANTGFTRTDQSWDSMPEWSQKKHKVGKYAYLRDLPEAEAERIAATI